MSLLSSTRVTRACMYEKITGCGLTTDLPNDPGVLSVNGYYKAASHENPEMFRQRMKDYAKNASIPGTDRAVCSSI